MVFEFRLTTPLGFSDGEIGVVPVPVPVPVVVVAVLESGEERDGGERGLVDKEVVVFGSIAKEEGDAEVVEEELVLVCRFRG